MPCPRPVPFTRKRAELLWIGVPLSIMSASLAQSIAISSAVLAVTRRSAGGRALIHVSGHAYPGRVRTKTAVKSNGEPERWVLAARLSRVTKKDRERGNALINGIQTQDQQGAEWARDEGHVVLADYTAHYNGRRPHRSRQLRPRRSDHPVADLSQEQIKRRPVLGGLINEYERAA